MNRVIYFLCFSFSTIAMNQLNAQGVQALYPGTIPNYIDGPNLQKSEVTGGIERISNVSVPTYEFFKAKGGKSQKPCVVVCPGGGYARLATGHEGIEVAEAFNKIGVTVFVLKYRLPFDSCMTNKEIVPLQDLQQTIKLVRDRAAGFDINPAMLGVIGFSAGGHLVSTGITKFSESYIENTSNTSLRPDFAILGYPVISMDSAICHKGSRDNLLGKKAAAAKNPIK